MKTASHFARNGSPFILVYNNILIDRNLSEGRLQSFVYKYDSKRVKQERQSAIQVESILKSLFRCHDIAVLRRCNLCNLNTRTIVNLSMSLASYL